MNQSIAYRLEGAPVWDSEILGFRHGDFSSLGISTNNDSGLFVVHPYIPTSTSGGAVALESDSSGTEYAPIGTRAVLSESYSSTVACRRPSVIARRGSSKRTMAVTGTFAVGGSQRLAGSLGTGSTRAASAAPIPAYVLRSPRT